MVVQVKGGVAWASPPEENTARQRRSGIRGQVPKAYFVSGQDVPYEINACIMASVGMSKPEINTIQKKKENQYAGTKKDQVVYLDAIRPDEADG